MAELLTEPACDVLLLESLFDEIKIAEPTGICYLAAAVRRRGFTVRIIDPSLEGWSVERTAEVILSIPCKIIGTSIHRDRNKDDVLELLKIVKPRAGERFVCAGGHGPSVAIGKEEGYKTRYTQISYQEIGKFVDAFVIGESEISFPGLIEKVLTGKPWRDHEGIAYLGADKSFIINRLPPKVENLDTLPFMARDVLEQYITKYGKEATSAALILGRGCLYRCSFCSVPKFEQLQAGLAHRQRSVANVIEEIREVYGKYGVSEFNFEDDTFIIPSADGIQKIHHLCDEILKLDFPIRFTMYCRADTVERELFAYLKKAGLTGIYFGIESVYQPDLDFFRKDTTVDTMTNAMKILLELGYRPRVGSKLRIMAGFITWHPLSTLAQLKASATFIRQYSLPPKLLRRKLRLYTGTPIRDTIEKLGLLNEKSEDGWSFKDDRFGPLYDSIEDFFKKINGVRDKIRTVEKAVAKHNQPRRVLGGLDSIRKKMDLMCLDYFDSALETCEELVGHSFTEGIQKLYGERLIEFRDFIERENLKTRIETSFRDLGIPPEAQDLFRK